MMAHLKAKPMSSGRAFISLSSLNLSEKVALPSALWVVMKRFTLRSSPWCAIVTVQDVNVSVLMRDEYNESFSLE